MRAIHRGILILAALAISGRGFAALQDVGTTGANFLKIPVPARAAAMGEAFSALSDDEGGFFYNPAGTARMVQNEISATHIEWFQGITLEHIGNVINLGQWGSFGQSMTWLRTDPQLQTVQVASGSPDPVNNYLVTGSFTPQDFNLLLNYAFSWGPQFNLGSNLKLIRQNIDKLNGWSVEGDLGAQYLNLIPGLDLGLEARDLGSPVTLGDGSTPPVLINGGLNYGLANHRFNISLEAQFPLDNALEYSAGVEWWLVDMLALRGGYKLGYLNQYTAGAGFKLGGLRLDYAFVPYGDLGMTHRISATYTYGAPSVRLGVGRTLLAAKGDMDARQTVLWSKIPHVEAVESWKIVMLDARGNTRQPFFGKGQPPLRWTWKGADEAERPLPDGPVTAYLSVRYRDGVKAVSEPVALEIDNTAPTISLKMGVAGGGSQENVLHIPAVLRPDLADKHGVGAWFIDILDAKGKVFRTIAGRGAGGSVSWDGTDGRRKFIESGQPYSFAVRARDGLGNWGRMEPVKATVLLNELHLNIASDLLFKPGKAELGPDVDPSLKKIADAIQKYHEGGTLVEVVGHTDSDPIKFSSFPNNQALSEARAKAVLDALVERFAIGRGILRSSGKGDTQPIADNAFDEGKQINRRVEIIIHTHEYNASK